MTTSPTRPQVRVLLADDSAIMLSAISKLLATQPELKLVAAVTNVSEAIRLAEELKPHVVVVDLRMTEKVKVEALRLKEEWKVRMLAITAASLDDEALALAADIGADKILDKMELDEKLVPTILELANTPN